jgi:hypothetical protein
MLILHFISAMAPGAAKQAVSAALGKADEISQAAGV